MAKGPQILTASRLSDGEVLYRKGEAWVAALAEADVFEEAEAAKAAQARAAEEVTRLREVINPYLFEVRIENGEAVPVKERELIRAAGPSVRRDLGKQAGPTAPHYRTGHTPHPPRPVKGDGPEAFDVSL